MKKSVGSQSLDIVLAHRETRPLEKDDDQLDIKRMRAAALGPSPTKPVIIACNFKNANVSACVVAPLNKFFWTRENVNDDFPINSTHAVCIWGNEGVNELKLHLTKGPSCEPITNLIKSADAARRRSRNAAIAVTIVIYPISTNDETENFIRASIALNNLTSSTKIHVARNADEAVQFIQSFIKTPVYLGI